VRKVRAIAENFVEAVIKGRGTCEKVTKCEIPNK
jgi:hypothetical protein